jgi:nucleoside-diphosphate-sugar epimerase
MLIHKRHSSPNSTSKAPQSPQKVFVTGAAGRIGSVFAKSTYEQFDLTLFVDDDAQKDADRLSAYGKIVMGRLEDIEHFKNVLEGNDTLVHLAAEPSAHAVWSTLQRDNITGTYNVFAAARAAGVRKILYASSVHAVSGYAPERQIATHFPVNPGDLYGVTKCFGEALGRYLAERENLVFFAIRIGAFQPREKLHQSDTREALTIWVSPRDLVQLFVRCIEDNTLQFGIFNGISNNRFKGLDISDARELLGYEPLDDAFSEDPGILDWQLPKLAGRTSRMNPEQSGLREEI